MKRYSGQPLPETAKIAVIANDAIGNFVVATPLLQMLRTKYPKSEIHYFGGKRTEELQAASDLFDSYFSLHGSEPRYSATHLLETTYDLTINLEQGPLAKTSAAICAGTEGWVVGPCLGQGGRGDLPYTDDWRGRLLADTEWIADDLTQKYPELQSGFIGEIFCRAAYLEGPIPPYRVPVQTPQIEIPDLLIATSASLPEKLWPLENWIEVLKRLKVQAGLLGAKPSVQKEHWKGSSAEDELVESGLVMDLRGKMSLPEVVGALAKTKAVLTLDNGILHLAVAAQTKTVGLFRYGIHRLWAPPSSTLQVLVPAPDKDVKTITVESVLEAVHCALNVP